ncbi:class II aldolase/adducin domain-containing protein [Suillus paluster]|uniref:class II aldolase/adducin domain-containing protein n=1 Tax=Suillus paluster TaxID=48578 RepID=UPI001B87359E|nr:class II aldolase/adducin domain-containing protein [Suillus paluster]KAG1717898.1 class II aldolase/adducin domain-containing protein [Suillus paluster]
MQKANANTEPHHITRSFSRTARIQISPVLKFRLAQAYHIFAKYGPDAGVAGHITVRDLIGPDCYWVNPWGVHFKLIQPELLLLLDHEGNMQHKKTGPIRFLNKAAYIIHSAIRGARPDVADSCAFYEDHVVFSDFRGVVNFRKEGVAIAARFQDGNHGLLVVTELIESTVYFFISSENRCQRPHIIDLESAALTRKVLGAELGGW